MIEFLIVRPGMTDFDIQRRLKGRLDIPLCALGVEQASAVAMEIARIDKPVALYSAPCQACLQTTEIIAKLCELRVRRSPELTNLDLGLWEGLQIDDIRMRQPTIYRRWQENPETVCPPEGEMLHEARRRLADLADRLNRKHREGIVVLVVPEPLATVLSSWLIGRPVGDLWLAEANFGMTERIAVPTVSAADRQS